MIDIQPAQANAVVSRNINARVEGAAPNSDDIVEDSNPAIEDVVELSPESNILLQTSGTNGELTEEQQEIIQDLKKTDQAIRSHEQAHQSVGGPYAGTATYETVSGPDGRDYAVAGEVPIDASPIRDNPEATIRKMDVVIRAALAPADPSSQDIAVAQSALQAKLQAQAELSKEQNEELRASIQGEDKEGDENNIIQLLFGDGSEAA